MRSATLYSLSLKTIISLAGSSSALSGWCPDLFACVDGACSLACANDHDCDGISDAAEEGIDTDLDGSDDSRDRDSDGDTIPDAVEFTSDMDGDLVPNYRDTDSDGDYLLDSFEVGIVPSQPLDFAFGAFPKGIELRTGRHPALTRITNQAWRTKPVLVFGIAIGSKATSSHTS